MIISRIKDLIISFGFWVFITLASLVLFVLIGIRHWEYIEKIVKYCVRSGFWQTVGQYHALIIMLLASILTVTVVRVSFNLFAQLMRHWVIQSWIKKNWIALPSVLRRLSSELNLTGRLRLVYATDPLVFTFGFIKPQICLSSGALRLLSGDELRAVLHHESKHVRDFDPMKIWLVNAVKKALWFLPLTRDVEENLALVRELKADEVAKKKMGTVKPLLTALFKIIEHQKQNDLGEQDAAYFNQPNAKSARGIFDCASRLGQYPQECIHAHLALTASRVEYWVSTSSVKFSIKPRNLFLSLLSLFLITAVYLAPYANADENVVTTKCQETSQLIPAASQPPALMSPERPEKNVYPEIADKWVR